MSIDPAQLTANTWLDAVEHHRELGSTQDRARAAAAEVPVERSLLVVTDRQSAGRGRGTNSWWTGEGSLAFSLLFDPARFHLSRRPLPQVSLVCGVALIDAISPAVPAHALGLHWPNDVYAAGRKLAGILVDVLPDGRHIVGIGANTNNRLTDAPEELRNSAATLYWLAGRLVNHTELLEAFLGHFATSLRILAREPDQIGVRFDELCLQQGQSLTLRHGAERTTGRCAGIAADGALLLDTEHGRQAFYSGTLR
jgi:BirA family biotin operon repressor/biotin-[acetyl-CoA-carboxylase] ligase